MRPCRGKIVFVTIQPLIYPWPREGTWMERGRLALKGLDVASLVEME